MEAAHLLKDNHVTILERGSTTTLAKNGLYSFNADLARVASSRASDGATGRPRRDPEEGQGCQRQRPTLKAAKFDRHQLDDCTTGAICVRNTFGKLTSIGSHVRS